VQVQELLGEYLDELGVVHGEEKGKSAEVDVVCRVDRLRGTEDGVSDRDTAAEERGVFYVVDAGGVVS
jgi:hypothetical protein